MCRKKLFSAQEYSAQEVKSFTQNAQIRRFVNGDFQIDNVRLDSIWTLSDLETDLTPNYSTFAVECDWTNKTFQNIPNLGSFWKINRFFEKKLIFFKKLVKVANLL